MVREKHPKASHHCFAYRFGADGNNFRSGDDGEPSGTAGRPILGQIDSKGLTNIGVIVVRYFGGVLLGVPGLIKAYKTAAALALQTVPVVQKSIETRYKLKFDYTIIDKAMKVIKKLNCTIYKQDVGLSCIMEIGVPAIYYELWMIRIKEIPGVELEKL